LFDRYQTIKTSTISPGREVAAIWDLPTNMRRPPGSGLRLPEMAFHWNLLLWVLENAVYPMI
jgi:hypothetical protein